MMMDGMTDWQMTRPRRNDDVGTLLPTRSDLMRHDVMAVILMTQERMVIRP